MNELKILLFKAFYCRKDKNKSRYLSQIPGFLLAFVMNKIYLCGIQYIEMANLGNLSDSANDSLQNSALEANEIALSNQSNSNDSSNSSMKESLKIFENPEFGKVRACLIEGEPWFVGRDIASILTYARPNDAVADHVDPEDKKLVQLSDIQDPRIPLPPHMKGSKIVVINKNGLISLIQKLERISRKKKKFLIEYFGLEDKFYAIERKEINFEDDLMDFFRSFGFEVKRQFRIGIYHADFYVPKFHLVIEYDEDGHNSYDKKKEEQRESYIKDAGFDVVRVDSRDSNVFNLGIIANYILNK